MASRRRASTRRAAGVIGTVEQRGLLTEDFPELSVFPAEARHRAVESWAQLDDLLEYAGSNLGDLDVGLECNS